MVPQRVAVAVAWRWEDWLSWQAARRRRRPFETSPTIKTLKAGRPLSVRIPSAKRLDRRPVCLRRSACGLRTDKGRDACGYLIRSSLESFMTAIYIVAAVIAVALVGYLCVALLKPEWFE